MTNTPRSIRTLHTPVTAQVLGSSGVSEIYNGLHCFMCGAETGNTDECVPCGLKRLDRERIAENQRICEDEYWERESE